MHKLDIPYFKQDTTYSCGAASAQMVLAYYGIHTSEERLMCALHTDRTYGTHHREMIELFTAHELFCYTNNNSVLEELAHHAQAKRPSIVHYLEPESDEGHYAVVTAVQDTSIILHDPWHGPDFGLDHKEFLARWSDERHEFPQWYCAIAREDFNVGRQYRPHTRS